MASTKKATLVWLLFSAPNVHGFPQAQSSSMPIFSSPNATPLSTASNLVDPTPQYFKCFSPKERAIFPTTVEACDDTIKWILHRDGADMIFENQTFYAGNMYQPTKGDPRPHRLPDHWLVRQLGDEKNCEVHVYGPAEAHDYFTLFDITVKAQVIVNLCLKKSPDGVGGYVSIGGPNKFLVGVNGWIPRIEGQEFNYTDWLSDQASLERISIS